MSVTIDNVSAGLRRAWHPVLHADFMYLDLRQP